MFGTLVKGLTVTNIKRHKHVLRFKFCNLFLFYFETLLELGYGQCGILQSEKQTKAKDGNSKEKRSKINFIHIERSI